MSGLLLADDVKVNRLALGSADHETFVELDSSVQTWLPDEVETSPEVAEVISRLPWWAVRSVLYIITAFILAASAWASVAKVDVTAVAIGTVIPQGNTRLVQAVSSGGVQIVFVKEGDKVKIGDPLVQLDASEVRTRLNKLRQELRTSQSQLRLLMVSQPITETLEQQNRIARLQTEISSAEKMLRHTSITSPVSGIVTTIDVRSPGEVLQEGQTIATIAPSDVPLVIEAMLPDKDIAFVEKGLAAKLKFEAFPFQDYGIFEGTIIEVSPDAIKKDGINYYKVTIAPTQNSSVTLRPGLSVSAEIVTERRSVLSLLLEPVRKLKNQIGD